MRIIAGEHRGRPLIPPPGDTTRPITDRVKQSVFDILSPRIEGARVHDIFAGTGSMGLECLSRGAAHATFFEADRGALAGLKKNIDTLQLTDRSTVLPGDLFKWFATQSAVPSGPAADLIFLDPPYRFLTDRPDDLKRLAEHIASHLAPQGLVIFRHDAKDTLALPALPATDVREYGGMTVEFLAKA